MQTRISRSTQALAARIRANSAQPLTLRQSVRRAMWLKEQIAVLEEQLADYHSLRLPRSGPDPAPDPVDQQ